MPFREKRNKMAGTEASSRGNKTQRRTVTGNNKSKKKSFMAALNQMNLMAPNLANLCAPLLENDQQWSWTEEHDKAFEDIKAATKRVRDETQQNISGNQ